LTKPLLTGYATGKASKTEHLYENLMRFLAQSKDFDDLCERLFVMRDWFLEKKVGIKFRPYQREFSNAFIRHALLRQGSELILLQARQSGKTEVVADTTLFLLFYYLAFTDEEVHIGLFAPVESMVAHVTRVRFKSRFRKVKKFLHDNFGIIQVVGFGEYSSVLVFRSVHRTSEVRIRTYSAGTSAEIIGPSLDIVIIEQSELVDESKMKNDIFPMLAEKGGLRILTGTTTAGLKNDYFRNAIINFSNDPAKNRSTADLVQIVDWVEAAKFSPRYDSFVKSEMKRLGFESIEFQTQYCLKWLGLKTKLISYDDLIDLKSSYESDPDLPRFFAIDVGEVASTVVTVIEILDDTIHILGWLELSGIDYETQMEKITEFLKDYAPLRFGLIDARGVGKPVFQFLKRLLRPYARIGTFNATVDTNNEMYRLLDRYLVKKLIYFTDSSKFKVERAHFIDQMTSAEREYRGTKLKLVAPRQKKMDYVASLAMAIYAFREKSFKFGAVVSPL